MPSVERDGMRIAYEVDGDGDEFVVLAHNMLVDRTIYRAVTPELRRLRKTVAVDLRGHGESRGVRKRFSTRDLADDLAAVMDAVGAARAVVVGVSIGACAAMEIALARPDRVEGLVLVGATPFAATTKDRVANGILAALARAGFFKKRVAAAIVRALFGASFHAEAPDVARVWEQRVAALAPRDMQHIIQAWTSRPLLLPRLSGIRAPTLVIVGDEDSACPPPHAEAIRAAIAGARVQQIDRAGHTTPLERPREVAAVIMSFLEGLAATTK